ncbi:MAG: CoA pyrophosphatase [Pseudomonadota bacterium]
MRDAAVLIGLVGLDESFAVLLTQRADHLKHHGGQVSFPGGSAEQDDADLVATALRETEEEVGIAPHYFDIVGTLRPRTTITGFRVTPVVGWARELPPLALQASEVRDAFLAPVAFLSDERNRRYEKRQFGSKKIDMVEWTYEGFRIWGATAMMLSELLDCWRGDSL